MTDGKSKQTTMELDTKDERLQSVEKFQFSPIKGYPMLNWRGKRPFTSTQFYPAQLKEIHGEEVDGWRNKIYWGDNLQVMSHLLKEFRGKVDLIYIDPPFDSKADYKMKISSRGEVASNDWMSFEEKQYSDIWNNDEYLQFMYERLVLAREMLSESGAFLLHCDWHKSHHLRCMLDEIFGVSNFRSEIIWAYPGREMHIESKYNAKHDNILFYAKSSDTKIYMKQIATAYDRDERLRTLRRKVHKDPDGREWVWETRGQSAGQKAYKRYVDDILEDGKAINDYWNDLEYNSVDDCWDDVQFLRGNAPERVGYPTQKPEALLERIIGGHTKPGGLVFDFFMGSGTTQSVAMRMGRRFIGADINLGAVQATTKRLIRASNSLRNDLTELGSSLYTGFEVYNVNNYDIFRNPLQAKELLLEALEVQALEFSSIFDGEKDGRMVKVMPVNRIATRADLDDLISGFDYKAWERKEAERPGKPVERITLVCMGHEPDLAAQLSVAVSSKYKIDVEVVDILRDKAELEFKRDSEALISIKNNELFIDQFFPMNLLQKLSVQREAVGDWRELTESVLIDWNYDGAVLQPSVVDVPNNNELVAGRYLIPEDAGTIRVKITDLLSESWEGNIANG